MNETEVIFHRNDRDDPSTTLRDHDAGAKVRRHDDDQTWVVESYEARTTRAMQDAGAKQLPSRIDGALFRVDARQLIEFIAASSGLNVEFRKHKKRQLSEATKARLGERMRGMNRLHSV